MKGYNRNEVKRKLVRATKRESVFESLGELKKGHDVFAFSKGQFSLSDVIAWALEHTGPAEVIVSTWTAAKADIENAYKLLDNGNIRNMRWLVDFSFPRRQPAYCEALRNRFGDGAIRLSKNHAKFVLVENDAFSVIIRTSMNMNENPRFEYLEVSESVEMASWLRGIIEKVFQDLDGVSLDDRPSKHEQRFAAFDRTPVGEHDDSIYGISLDDPKSAGLSVGN